MRAKTAVFLVIFAILVSVGNIPAWADGEDLPIRSGPRPATTAGVPHMQIGVEARPELSLELLRRVATIPDVEIRESVVSLPGAKGFWLDDEIPLAHPEVIVGGREFAHIHPDGSLHASLPPHLALEAVDAGWAIHHPWSDQRAGLEWVGDDLHTPVNGRIGRGSSARPGVLQFCHRQKFGCWIGAQRACHVWTAPQDIGVRNAGRKI